MAKKMWHKVLAPRIWNPKQGAAIEGKYLQSAEREGQFGPYKVHYIETSNKSIYYVSGTIVSSLFALISPGEKVRLIYTGKKISAFTGHEYKTFELYTEKLIELKIAM